MEPLLMWIGGAVAFLASLAALWKVVHKISGVVRRVVHFLDDWSGEEARPGVEARAGVIERLHVVEIDLQKIKHELHPNSGTSLRDAVDRVEKAVSDDGKG